MRYPALLGTHTPAPLLSIECFWWFSFYHIHPPHIHTSTHPHTEPCNQQRLNVVMYDSYGDTWNGNVLNITLCDGTVVASNLKMDNHRHVQGVSVCVPNSAGYGVSVDGGSWQYEVHWSILNYTNMGLLSGGAPFLGSFNCPKRKFFFLVFI